LTHVKLPPSLKLGFSSLLHARVVVVTTSLRWRSMEDEDLVVAERQDGLQF